MAQRRFHYEQAFEHYLRANRVPYVAVDEAKKALLPEERPVGSLKSFDFVVYTPGRNLLIDVKGRKHAGGEGRRLESWVTIDDVESLERWQRLFGRDFQATFVFAYWCDAQPPDALFQEVFDHGGRWYALREVPLEAYRKAMTPRSTRWSTVHVATEMFARISRPFTVRGPDARPARRAGDAGAISGGGAVPGGGGGGETGPAGACGGPGGAVS